MPIYEYKCGRCHHCFELRQSFDAETVSSCPACQSEAQRVLQPVGIVFKGSGFYVTDSRRDDGGQAGKKQTKSEMAKGLADSTKEPVGDSSEKTDKTTSEKLASKEASP